MPHALIVDDHSDTLSSLAELVEREGFSTSRARSLQTAREELPARPPDVILLDLHLPDGEGLTLLDELDPRSSPAVVLMTGQASVASAISSPRGSRPRSTSRRSPSAERCSISTFAIPSSFAPTATITPPELS